MSEAKPTPGPWEVRKYAVSLYVYPTTHPDAAPIALVDSDNPEADAALIVKAVNCHHDLSIACLEASAILNALSIVLADVVLPPELAAKMVADCKKVEALCDAALEKASTPN